MNYRAFVISVTVAWLAPASIAFADTFTVINTDDTGAGSLRQAMTDANAHIGLDTIAFNIPGSGVHTITPVTGLPGITDPVLIDGLTQPGASPNTLANADNAVLLIELAGAPTAGGGLSINSGGSGSTIRGLVINRFSDGIDLFANNCFIEGNFLGTDPTGLIARPNTGHGLQVGGDNNLIGGTSPSVRNISSGNLLMGIFAGGSNNNLIQGNFIGVDATGGVALGNGSEGIRIVSGGSGNLVGGTTAGARNIISGNVNDGAVITFGPSGNTIQGNFIGTDVTGTKPLGNADGVQISGNGNNSVIGNVISASRQHGVILSGSAETNALVQGNFIGTDVTGSHGLGNANDGVIVTDAIGATIGGTGAGQGNIIAYNGDIGVSIFFDVTMNNRILGNSIFANTHLGIDLHAGDGVTPNHPCNTDPGPNHYQNYPVLKSVANTAGNVNITGTLNSIANTTFRLEFFSNDAVDPSGFGEGQIFLGFRNVTTDADCNADFDVSFPAGPGAAHVTATATDPMGNTSEFSAAIGQLLNISTRLKVQTGENVLIGGFIIAGTDPKRVLVRGIGPSLAQFFQDFLADPTLELHGPAGFVTVTNDNWKINSDGGSQQAEIEATGIAPTNDLESALVQTLSAADAAYTAIVRGKDDGTGIGLVEAYDLDTTVNSKLANISTRGFVDTGNNVLIGGFIAGNGLTKVIIRAIGPSLAQSGVSGVLADPTLELHDGNGAVLASNDNWRTGGQEAEIIATTIPPADDLESAIVATLVPGAYTAIVAGTNSTTGVGLVEVYNIQGSCVAPPSNLVSWWPGDSNASDIRGGNNGELQNGATFAPGKVDQAFSFDGVDDLVNIPDAANLQLNTFTIDAWVKSTENFSHDQAILIKSALSPQTGNEFAYGLRILAGGHAEGRITDASGAGVSVVSTSTVSSDQFHLIAFSYDGAALKIYVDGVLDGTTASNATPVQNTNPVSIGAWQSSSAGVIAHWAGLIDEVEVFNRALTASEIMAIYNADSFGKCKP